ncbi:MAG: response regulator transcription factor [Chloroflexi bacterium]|nr:response regulator transcription factor [Chloroflexota bacterium]
MLIVDDEPAVRDALRALVGGWGFAVSTAASGPAAIDTAAREQPDLVILDLAMPGMHGIDVCLRLRERSGVPILVLSARGEESQKVAALESGADDYVTKPFGPAELRARIRASLRREQGRHDETSRVIAGALVVDLAARRVLVDGNEVHLTPTEYALLRVLVTNPDRVLTHASLLRSILGPAHEDALESLRTYIKQLRRKIAPDPARPRLIVNEPGVGYRFVPEPMSASRRLAASA